MVEWKGLAGLTNLATGPAPRRSKRLKFRFEDQDEESSSVQDSRKVTSDDILESLQKQSGDRLQDTDLGEEEIADDDENVDEDIEDSIDGPVGPHSPLILRKAILSKHAHNNNRRFGFFILVLMALAIVGVYESVMRYSDPFYYARRISSFGPGGLLGNSFELILISFTGIVALALLMRRHRNHLSKPAFAAQI